MYRKVISVVFVLGLMTLVVSAQQPTSNRQLGDTDRPTVVVPAAPGTTSLPSLGTADPTAVYPRHETLFSGSAALGRGRGFDFGRQSQELVKQFTKAKGEEREKLKTKLTEALERQFDLRQKHHQEEIAALEAQINKLKELVQKRQDNRRDIVTRRFEQLVRDAEGLGW